ncbi:MAG: FGGY-family carbohydrate kinase [Promethearchaeota archaeon]
MTSPSLLAIDFGTSGIKCMVFTAQGEVQARQFTIIEYYVPEGLTGIGREFDATFVWKATEKMIRACLRTARCKPEDIVGVAATSQRHGAVFLDDQGEPLYAGPNLDARGVFTQGVVAQQLQDSCPPTGCWPPLLYSLCRLLWFKQHKPDTFAQIRHALSISDWLVFQLTGEVTTEPSQASSTQFMDIRTSKWSPEILEMAGIPEALLPPIKAPGTLAGTITASTGQTLGLKPGTPVGIGGADTQCALLGSGVTTPGSVCVVAGNTSPIQLVTAEPLIDEECKLWTGRYLLPNLWVLEANTGTTGSVLTWFARNIIHPADLAASKTDEELYLRVEQLADDAKAGSLDAVALLGPQVMDASDMTTVRPALFVFPQPASPVTKPIGLKDLARSLYENICYAVRVNLELLQVKANVTFERCLIAGGQARSQFWQQMLANVTNIEVQRAEVMEASSLGAAICAAVAANLYPTLETAAENMVTLQPALKPELEIHNQYETYFGRWKGLYNQSGNL